jgi:hypothetical protein
LEGDANPDSLWGEGHGSARLLVGFLSITLQPKTFKHSPALLLNTTEIQSGNRRLIAPFEFKGAGGLEFLPLQDTRSSEPSYLPLSTAAILSARFPWVTPYGWISGQGKNKDTASQIVDGGYFENSGAATAMDLIKDLVPALQSSRRKVEINLIILTSEDFAPPSTLSGETLGPIQVMLNTRSARASIEIDRAKLDLQSLNSEQVSMRAI